MADEADIAVSAMIQRAKISVSQLQRSHAESHGDVLGRLSSSKEILSSGIDDTWGTLLDKIQIFADLAQSFAEVRPV